VASVLNELRARQIVRHMHGLRVQVDSFAIHARTLRRVASSIDAAALMQEGDKLLRGLMESRTEFRELEAGIPSLSRRPPAGGGMAPAAKWGPEIRAAIKQFTVAVQNAEKELIALHNTANDQLNSPTRISTSPDNLLELIMSFIDLLTKWLETRKK
jgi:hypothetical protein